MRKNVFFAGMFSIVLALGALIIGCDNGSPSPNSTEYTVTFNADGGDPASQTKTVKSGDPIGSSNMPVAPVKTGYEFGGWYAAQNGGGTEFTATTTVTENITVYAKWTAKEYKVTFKANGGTVTPESKTVVFGTVVESPTPTKTSGDTAFWGWYTKDGTNSGEWGSLFITLTVAADIDVYARWGSSAPTKYTVTFDADTGTVTPKTVEVVSGEKIEPPIPTKPGYTFDGWYTAQNGGGEKFTATTPITAAITVYAKWKANSSEGPGPGPGPGTAIDAKWQGTYVGGKDLVTINANTATFRPESGAIVTTSNISTATGGDILFSGIDVGDWVYILAGGNRIGFAMIANNPLDGSTNIAIGIGIVGAANLIGEVTGNGGSFSPPPSTSGFPADYYFWGRKQ
jgi:uncharacterized repeat protein (TIGR02543 family)